MGLTYHFSFAAPARTRPEELEAFLKIVEAEAIKMGFCPTLVLDAVFDTPERKEFARTLVTGEEIEDERLKGVALPAPGILWSHDRHHGTARVIPSRGIFLVVTDEQRCETIFGFFKYPGTILDVNGKPLARTGLRNRWVSRNFVNTSDPRFRKLVSMFSAAGYVESEKDEFATRR